MRSEHPIAYSAAAAIVAAVLVFAVYNLRKGKDVSVAQADATVQSVEADALPKVRNVPPIEAQHLTPPAPPPRAPFTNDRIGKDAPSLPPSIRDGMKPPQLPDNLPAPEELREQFELLRRFLELPPERLAKIRESIERIERMSPERKSMMLNRIQGVDLTSGTSTPQNRSPLADAPAEIRLELSRAIENMPQEERRALMEKLRSFTSEQRIAYFEGMAQGLGVKCSSSMPWSTQSSQTLFETK